jgi:ankyrin repeat protein
VTLLREVLTRAGTDVNKIDGSTNVLHVACRGGSREVVAMLVEEFNADPNKKSQAPIVSAATRSRLPTHMNWHTPLSFAVGSGSEETVQWLLEHRARAELGDCVGCLIAASAKGVPSLVRLFLEKLRPRSGWTAELLGNGDAASAKLLDDVFLTAIELASVRNLTSLQLLLADAPAGLAKKATAALDMAVRAGNAPAVGELLKHGVPPTKGPGEWAPIHDAAVGGNLELIRLLVQYGADAGAHPNHPMPTAIDCTDASEHSYAGIAVHYGGDRQNAHMIALQTHGKPDVVEFLRTAPSPMQREAQLVFRIVIACLSLALLVAAWFTI